jgi:hypothetical protein
LSPGAPAVSRVSIFARSILAPGLTRHRSASRRLPGVVAAHEQDVLVARVGDDPEDRLVVLGAGRVDDADEKQLAHLGRRSLGEGRARHGLERRALPAHVLGPGAGQRTIGLAQGRPQLCPLAAGVAAAGDDATDDQ